MYNVCIHFTVQMAAQRSQILEKNAGKPPRLDNPLDASTFEKITSAETSKKHVFSWFPEIPRGGSKKIRISD